VPRLSIAIITLNEALNIQSCIDSVKSFASEILVVDSGSADVTAERCEAYSCRVLIRAFDGFAAQKKFAVDNTLYDWVFSIDADEVVSPELEKELQKFAGKTIPVEEHKVKGYYIPFILHFMGRIIKHSGKGKNLRLFDRRYGRFKNVLVHETLEIEGKPGTMKGRIIHFSYRDISHHFEKINFYSSPSAEGYYRKVKKFSLILLSLRLPATFGTFYFRMFGFHDGYPGFMWAFLAGIYSTIKAAKTIELDKRK
jgi:glycosyltransferase involved in cell wall biosynthesis